MSAREKIAPLIYCAACGAPGGSPCTSKGDGRALKEHFHTARLRDAEGVLVMARVIIKEELSEKGWSPPRSAL